MVWRYWGSGRPLVMLHGGSGSWTHWVRNVSAVVAAGRTACIPDLPGFGDSHISGEDADQIVEPILRGMEQVLGPGAHDVAAFSFGSLVAILMAVTHPRAVSRLLFAGPPVFPLLPGAGVPWRRWRGLPTSAERDAAHRDNLAALMMHRDVSIDEPAVRIQQLNAERDRMPRRKLVTTDAFGRALAHLQCSFSAIYGAEDILYRGKWTEVRAALRSTTQCRSIELVPNAGHWVQYEEPDAFNQLLVEWLVQDKEVTAPLGQEQVSVSVKNMNL